MIYRRRDLVTKAESLDVEWVDPYDGNPITDRERYLIEKSRIESDGKRTYSSEELLRMLED